MSAVDTLETASPEVKRYQRLKLYASVAGTILSLGWLVVLGFILGPRLDLSAVVGDSAILRLLAMGLILVAGSEVLTLPLEFWSGYVLEHRFGLSNQTLAGWIKKRLLGYLVGGMLGGILIIGLYAIIWSTGAWWWVWATLGFLLFSLVLGKIMPVLILPLFYKVTRLEDAGLQDRLKRLADGTGLTIEGVYRLHLSEDTKKANAALAGLGNTRRVLLGDTLLEQFTPEEIEVVFAHEVGHHVYRHLIKGIVLGVMLTFAGFWLVDRLLGTLTSELGYAGLGEPAALPLVLLVLGIFSLLLTPAQNALSRFFEVQCDTYALRRTRNAEAYRGAFTKLARINKADPDPHFLTVCFFYDHPPIRARLALADNLGAVPLGGDT